MGNNSWENYNKIVIVRMRNDILGMVKLSEITSSDKPDKYAGIRAYWAKVHEHCRIKIIEALRNLDKDKPFLNLNELTEAVGHSYLTVKRIVEELVKEGKIVHKKLNLPIPTHMYYLPDDYIRGIEVEKILTYNKETYGGE